MKPPFCRIGSKLGLVSTILPMIPPHLLFVELFCGSAVITFNKPKIATVINDIDTELINSFQLIKSGILIDPLPNTLLELNELYYNPVVTDTDKLLHFFLKSNHTFSNTGRGKLYKINNKTNNLKLNHFPIYREKLANITILNQDYRQVIGLYNNTTTFFFLDPPYENSEVHSLYNKCKSKFDYVELARQVKLIKGMFLLTINDSPYIRLLFKDFIIKDVTVDGSHASGAVGSKNRPELFILNYVI